MNWDYCVCFTWTILHSQVSSVPISQPLRIHPTLKHDSALFRSSSYCKQPGISAVKRSKALLEDGVITLSYSKARKFLQRFPRKALKWNSKKSYLPPLHISGKWCHFLLRKSISWKLALLEKRKNESIKIRRKPAYSRRSGSYTSCYD